VELYDGMLIRVVGSGKMAGRPAVCRGRVLAILPLQEAVANYELTIEMSDSSRLVLEDGAPRETINIIIS